MTSIEVLVLETLARASSQQVAELKTAEIQLAEWETKPGFYTTLLQIIANHQVDHTVRFMAALQLKNGVDRYWRRMAPNAINDEEKKTLKDGLLSSTTINEPVNQVAVQLAVIIAKVSRFDFPKEWPELVPSLMELIMKGEGTQMRALLILHHVIKTLASKRLVGDRRVFHELTGQLYPFIHSLFNSSLDLFFVQGQNTDPRCQSSLEKALLTLRILRKLTMHGYNQPKDSPEASAFISSTFDRIRNMLHVRSSLGEGSPMLETVEKLIVHLTKVLLALLENHPFSFIPFILPSLNLAVSLVFTASGEGLVFPRLIVNCMNLIKGVLLCAEYKESKPIDDEPADSICEGARIKNEFFTMNIVTEMCTKFVTHYLLLSSEELDVWDSDPEGFLIEDGADLWKYNLRPCSERLFLALFHAFRDSLRPVLMHLLYSLQPVIDPNDLQAVLRKDAVFLAVGYTAFELYDEIDIDKWFATLLQEITIKGGHYRIIRSRAAWLLGELCGVKLPSAYKPTLYRALMPLLQGDEDMVVRLTAANALKTVIDDFEFDSEQFLQVLEPLVGLVYNLLREAKECDTKMHVLTVLSDIVERVGAAVRPYSQAIVQYLPLLWQEASDHDMLRCSILSTLSHCVRALLSDEMSPLLYSVLEVCLDISQPPHVYLLEDGLELWQTTLEHTSSINPQLMHLLSMMPQVLDKYLEHLVPCCNILEIYILLAPSEVLLKFGESIFVILYNTMMEVKPSGVAAIYKLIEAAMAVDPASTIHMAMPIIETAFESVYTDCQQICVLSESLSILSRVLMHSQQGFCQIVEKVGQTKGETAEATLDLILSKWLERMDLVTNNTKRKLLALALTSLMTADSNVVFGKMVGIIENVVEVLNDVSEVTESGDQIADHLVRMGPDYLLEGSIDSKTPHEVRVTEWGNRDPVFKVELKLYLKSQMDQLAERIGSNALEGILNNLNPEILNELKLFACM